MRLTLLTLSILTIINIRAQLVVNEYCAANLSVTPDNYGEYQDWFEIYNTGSSAVDLTGWYLSDNPNKPFKNQLTGGSVPAGGHLLVICSGRDEVSGGMVHTSFKLTQTKPESILISDAAGILVDQVDMIPCQLGHSRGRDADGSSTWALYTTPTPAASNTNPKQDYATTPVFDIASGNQLAGISLNITTPDPNVTLHYTIDGTTPTAASPQVSGAITINNHTVVRAIAISSDPNIPNSFIETNTYFINASHTVPILSICGEGIYDFITDQDWNAFTDNFDGAIEMFTSAGVLIDEGEGFYNKHGNDSWAYDQRGIDFIMKDQYGYNYAIQHQIFRGKSRDEFQKLIIKAAANDNFCFEPGGAYIRDAYVHSLSQVGGLRMDERSYEPCVMYVNGEYWGLYEIREKVDDDDFTDYYYDQDEKYNGSPEYIQFLKTWGATWEEYGAPNAQPDWDALKNFITSNNMADPANFDYVDSVYNWKSLVDYFCINSYTVCMDWLNWNTAQWRGLDTAGTKKKWRYVLWDMDATFGHYVNYTGIPDETANADPCDPENLPDPGGQGHTNILGALMANPTFEQYYISRYIDLGNSTFGCDFMIAHLDSLIALIAPEMPQQVARWGSSVSTWDANVQSLKTFITDRCTAIEQGMIDCYQVTGPYELTYDVQPAGAGDIKVNSLWLDAYPWVGTYYGNIDILLRADANAGYVFDYWESSLGDAFTPSADTTRSAFQTTGAQTITAHFRLEGDPPSVVYDGINIPTAFSPNGDNQNDLLELFIGKDVDNFNFQVYSRWGEVIFESSSIATLWDGTYNGVGVNSGVYVYKLNVQMKDGTSIIDKGNITLVR